MRKDSWRIELNGAVDEAQAAIGLARAEAEPGSELDERLTALARDLYVLMAEVATAPENRTKLTAGSTLVTPDMVGALEAGIDDLLERFDLPSDFTVPGENRVAAALDFARTVVRRAERIAVVGAGRRGRWSWPTSTGSPTCSGPWRAGRRGRSTRCPRRVTETRCVTDPFTRRRS